MKKVEKSPMSLLPILSSLTVRKTFIKSVVLRSTDLHLCIFQELNLNYPSLIKAI